MNGPCLPLALETSTFTPRLAPALGKSPLRDAIRFLTRAPEPDLLPGLVEQARLSEPQASATRRLALDAVLHHGSASALLAIASTLALRPGPIIGVTGFSPGDGRVPLERLVVERSVRINTAAAGGNA